jgi:hypothetical protein
LRGKNRQAAWGLGWRDFPLMDFGSNKSRLQIQIS